MRGWSSARPGRVHDLTPPPAHRGARLAATTPLVGLPVSASDGIRYVDLQLAQDNIAIDFDDQQVPTYQGVFATQ